MRKQGLTIAALIVAIIGLSIGFAAFSNTLTISQSATVNPSDQNFIVEFASESSGDTGNSDVTITPTQATSDYGTNATIPYSNKKSLTGVHATFTAPGQSVTYELYVRNAGQYTAYLKDLEFGDATNAVSGETYKHCYAKTTNVPVAQQATGTLVSSACEGISISVTIGTASNITPESVSKSLGNQALSANGGYVAASVTITYAAGSAYVDGPMEVEFGDISFIASSNPSVQQQEQASPSVTVNPWRTRGLTSNDVVFGETYIVNNQGIKPTQIIMYDDGRMYSDQDFSNEMIESLINSGDMYIGPDYMLLKHRDDETGQYDLFMCFVVESNGIIRLYIAYPNVEFTKNSITNNYQFGGIYNISS